MAGKKIGQNGNGNINPSEQMTFGNMGFIADAAVINDRVNGIRDNGKQKIKTGYRAREH